MTPDLVAQPETEMTPDLVAQPETDGTFQVSFVETVNLSMTKPWEDIANCLRAELADYGGLLNLFQEQQRTRLARDPEAMLRFATRIEAQAQLIALSRRRREQAVAAFAGENGRPLTASLRTMLPLIEADARPLLQALSTEVNLLLHRVRRASRQSHTQLARAVEVLHHTLQHLRPAAVGKSSVPVGRLAAATGHHR
jgi:hypothetical protein